MSTIIFRRSKAEVDREVAAIDWFGKKIARSKKSARAFLVKAGILTKDGKRLSKHYR